MEADDGTQERMASYLRDHQDKVAGTRAVGLAAAGG
jgi:hypothetical protein